MMDLNRMITIVCPAVVALLYMATGVAFLWRHNWAWAAVWLCYAVANVGLILAGGSRGI